MSVYQSFGIIIRDALTETAINMTAFIIIKQLISVNEFLIEMFYVRIRTFLIASL